LVNLAILGFLSNYISCGDIEISNGQTRSRSWIRACSSSPSHCCNLLSHILLCEVMMA
jgi:hypothetical protein